jgi:tetratricopeptide (TPR) repeat protein
MGWLAKLLGLKDKRIHYSDYVELVKKLKQEKRYSEAIELLLKLVDDTETEAKAKGWGVAPWYYEQLAIIYRKEKRYSDEIAILERYEAQQKAPGEGPKKLAERLKKAKERFHQGPTRSLCQRGTK